MSDQKQHRILVIDDSRSVRAFFEDVFSKKDDYAAEFASSGEEAIELFRKNSETGGEKFDFVLSDINMTGMDGFETLDSIRNIDPDVKTGMITGFNVDDYIKIALERGIYNIISKTDSPADIIKTVDNLITGENILGIENHLEEGAKFTRIEVTNTTNLKNAVNDILDFASDVLDDEKIYGLKTGLVEMGTNAIYHAYGYEKGTQVELKDREKVYIDYGADSEKMVVVIVDTSGTLSRKKVLSQLNKCINPTQEDLIASGGRGLYLTRYLCDKLIINIEKGQKTEILLIMYFEKDYEDSKPLLINQL